MARNISKLKDSKYRKETKEERASRLKAAAEAREKCLRLLPSVVALLVGLMALFSFYVHSMPPETKTTKTARTTTKVTKTARTPKANSVPEGLKKTPYTDEEKNAMLEEAIRNGALDKAKAILDEENEEQEPAKVIPASKKEGETEEL